MTCTRPCASWWERKESNLLRHRGNGVTAHHGSKPTNTPEFLTTELVDTLRSCASLAGCQGVEPCSARFGGVPGRRSATRMSLRCFSAAACSRSIRLGASLGSRMPCAAKLQKLKAGSLVGIRPFRRVQTKNVLTDRTPWGRGSSALRDRRPGGQSRDLDCLPSGKPGDTTNWSPQVRSD